MRPLEPGDLVRLVQGCCPEVRRHLWGQGVLRELQRWEPIPVCDDCGFELPRGTLMARLPEFASSGHVTAWLPAAWLERISPPQAPINVSETEPTDLEVTA